MKNHPLKSIIAPPVLVVGCPPPSTGMFAELARHHAEATHPIIVCNLETFHGGIMPDVVEEIMEFQPPEPSIGSRFSHLVTEHLLAAMRRDAEAKRMQDQFHIERAQAKRERKAREKAARHGKPVGASVTGGA